MLLNLIYGKLPSIFILYFFHEEVHSSQLPKCRSNFSVLILGMIEHTVCVYNNVYTDDFGDRHEWAAANETTAHDLKNE